MRHPLILLFAFVLFSCGSGRKHLEHASAYEREGMMQEAFDRYAALYQRKPKLVEAHVGMKRTAQHVLDRLQENASRYYMANDLYAGDRAKKEAVDFRSSAERRGLMLEWDPLLETRRREAVAQVVAQLHSEAETAFKAGRFEEAEEAGERCLDLDPGNKEAANIIKLAQLEPRYHKARRAIELQLWRDAYMQLKAITDRDHGYKDAWQLQEYCREHASYTLAYLPLVNPNGVVSVDKLLGGMSIEHQLAASIKDALLELNDPLLILIDRESMDDLLAEQRRNMSGVYDDRYTSEAGKLMGARFVLAAKILRFDDIISRHIDVQIKLMEVETGRIVLADVIRVNKQELARGAPRGQLIEIASARVAERFKDLDPFAR